MSELPNIRAHQAWYAAVAASAPEPDLAEMELDEARKEFDIAPFEGATSLEELARTTERNHGMTETLLSAMGEGSQLALGLLVERCQPRILGMVRQRLGRSLRAYVDSGEVQQEVNFQVLRSIHGFVPREDGAFVAWLYTIVKNRIGALHRRHTRRPERAATAEALDGVTAAEPKGNPDRDVLEPALNLLANRHPAYADAVRLRLEGLSIRRIAERMGRTEASAGMLLVRAKQKLAPIVRSLRED